MSLRAVYSEYIKARTSEPVYLALNPSSSTVNSTAMSVIYIHFYCVILVTTVTKN